MASKNGNSAEVFKRLFLKIEVSDRRVEITEGMWPFRKKTVIGMSNISSVDVSKFTRQLSIRTNDGRNKKVAIPRHVYAVRDAIQERVF